MCLYNAKGYVGPKTRIAYKVVEKLGNRQYGPLYYAGPKFRTSGTYVSGYPGFHAYKTLAGAKRNMYFSRVILKVSLSNIRTEGLWGSGIKSFTAGKMKVLKVVYRKRNRA